MKVRYIIPVFVVLACIILMIYSKKQVENNLVADFSSRIDTVTITGLGEFGAGRGGVYYKEHHVISTAAKYVYSSCNFDNWKSKDPLIDFNQEPIQYRLSDLSFPYVVFKRAHSDTLYIDKDGCRLSFLISKDF